jgi:predicted transcriptional regulator
MPIFAPSGVSSDRRLQVDTKQQNPYIWGMEVHFTLEQEAQLSRIATHAGMDTEHLVKDAALRVVEERNRFSAAVREGIAEADRGELIDDDEIRLWLEQQERS